MVVVLIIGILVAIALPTFLGARNRANDKAAQSGLRNALAAAKTMLHGHDDYYDTGCDATRQLADDRDVADVRRRDGGPAPTGSASSDPASTSAVVTTV